MGSSMPDPTSRRCGRTWRRSGARRRRAGTSGSRGCRPSASWRPGSRSSARRAVWPSRGTRSATWWRGGARPARARWSPGRTWTRCWTAERTTARSASSRRSRRSTCCGRGGSCRPGRWASRCSWRRRGRGSGWPAWGRGWRRARCRGRRLASCATGPGCSSPTALSAAGLSGIAGPRPAGGCRHVRGAARRAGPRPGGPVCRGRGGQRDLAARAVPVRVHRVRRPRRARRGWRTAPTRC